MIVCRLAQWARQVHLRPSRDSRVAPNTKCWPTPCFLRRESMDLHMPSSTMAGRLIDKLRLRSQKPGPVRAVRDIHRTIRTRPIACSTSRIQYFALSPHYQCRLSSYPSPTSIAICPISSATASSSPRHVGRYLPYLRYTEEEAVMRHAIEQLHVPHTMR